MNLNLLIEIKYPHSLKNFYINPKSYKKKKLLLRIILLKGSLFFLQFFY